MEITKLNADQQDVSSSGHCHRSELFLMVTPRSNWFIYITPSIRVLDFDWMTAVVLLIMYIDTLNKVKEKR
jgi:hypothetical protein